MTGHAPVSTIAKVSVSDEGLVIPMMLKVRSDPAGNRGDEIL